MKSLPNAESNVMPRWFSAFDRSYFSYLTLLRVSQNLAKLGGGGGGEAHKMSRMEGGENWSKLGTLGGRVSTLALRLESEM